MRYSNSTYRRTTRNLQFITNTKQKRCSVCKASIPDDIPFVVAVDYEKELTAKQFKMCICCMRELMSKGEAQYRKVPEKIREEFETNRFVGAL